MKGKRIYNDEHGNLHVHLFEPGNYGKWANSWFCRTPNGLTGNLSGHQIAEHDDGTITASPSILITGEKSWHGYLEHGEWREC